MRRLSDNLVTMAAIVTDLEPRVIGRCIPTGEKRRRFRWAQLKSRASGFETKFWESSRGIGSAI